MSKMEQIKTTGSLADVDKSHASTGQQQPSGDTESSSGSDVHPARRGPRVLSTSLGVALAANMMLNPGWLSAGTAYAAEEVAQPKLTEWSTEAVKEFFNPSVDWSLPALPEEDLGEIIPAGSGAATGSPVSGTTGGTQPVIIHQGSSFGWDDMLLYHLLFNRGGSYSSGSWHQNQPVYDARTNQPYQPKTYSQGAFENKPVTGSNVKPKTTASSGTFSTKAGLAPSKSSGTKSAGTTSGTKSTGTTSGTTSGTKSTDTTSGTAAGTKSTGTTSGTTSSAGKSSGSTSDSSVSSKSSSSAKSSSSTKSSSSSKSSSSGSIGSKSSGFSSSSGS